MAGTLEKKDIDPAMTRMQASCYKSMKRAEDEKTNEFIKTMSTLKHKLDVDELYCKKFGLLKKASVLAHYGREKDAKFEIAKAATIVQQ